MKRHLTNLKDVDKALRPYVPLVKELTGKNTVLDRIKPLMSFLGHPEDKLLTIHLAGTSGKTSTAYYISDMLTLAGKKVGLTVSPHIDKITERTQINGQPLSDSDFCIELSQFLEIVDQSNIKPSYFELIYAFSIWLFAKYKVDYAVIETGLGGLYDATNVVTREDKVCVITDIGFDHMNILGHSIAEITAQKVGIVHKNNVLLMYQQSREVMQVIKNWLKDQPASLLITNQKSETELYGRGKTFSHLANYQKRNWLLAYYVYRYLAKRDNLPKLSNRQLIQSQKINIPARMDVIKKGQQIIIMDGAHNYQKMKAFISSYKEMFPNTKPACLIAFKSDKYYLETLPLIKQLASEIIITSFKTSQDLPVVSTPPKDIYKAFKNIGVKNIIFEPNNLKAYQLLLQSTSKYLVITGSFYLIAQIRQGDNR